MTCAEVEIDPWYLANIICPRDHHPLKLQHVHLICTAGHTYPVVDGVPVMLLDDVPQTIGIAEASIEQAKAGSADDGTDGLYLDTLGVSATEKAGIKALARDGQCPIDPVVAYAVAATSGNM